MVDRKTVTIRWIPDLEESVAFSTGLFQLNYMRPDRVTGDVPQEYDEQYSSPASFTIPADFHEYVEDEYDEIYYEIGFVDVEGEEIQNEYRDEHLSREDFNRVQLGDAIDIELPDGGSVADEGTILDVESFHDVDGLEEDVDVYSFAEYRRERRADRRNDE
ncbi:hypothetical protein [Natrarchaeobaculum aegyptiacum]|nr:hypothetical protein [Natrarchaeobaculum aegyptiacum]